ncbi:PhzF family phenazine biosynthesis protein [uncultured Gilvimarinus sp.]|uniref:PhzF family phenazine biosynthesis protein n=1 Tax=uncultured Gilvimarinus sp. TaxID=1689143 RepID=UPI0030EEE4F7|tara:strand:+ start:5022 stop:5807 length:786 start_codon:yes stop_codon:yes gene_type:complete
MIIDSFCGANARGNRHHIVHLKPRPPGDSASCDAIISEAQANSLISASTNTVLLWQQQRQWQARFYDRGQPVRRCGSGTIAVAAYLCQTAYHGDFTQALETAAGRVIIGHDRHGAHYTDYPCAITGFDNRRRWARLCQTPIHKAVRIGGRQDYTLLLLPDTHALQQMKPPGRSFALYSRRSVIALCPAPHHWQLRYFAPQYGVPEDAATGSACVQASAYLTHIGKGRHFDFVQYSPARGIMHTEVLARRVTVRGHYNTLAN